MMTEKKRRQFWGNRLEINIRERDNVIIFDIDGEIRRTAENVVSLHQIVKDQLAKNKRNFLINFEKVKFIDSMGVGELIASFKSVHDAGGKLKLMKLPPKIKLLFEITMLIKVFEIFDDEDEAIASFS